MKEIKIPNVVTRVMKKQMTKRMTSFLLILTMLSTLLTACGNTGDDTGSADNSATDAQTTSAGTNTNGQDNTANPDEPTAMGRYVENVIDMSDKLSGMQDGIFKLNDGSIIITDVSSNSSFWISKDNGETWEEDDWAWHKKMIDDEVYVSETAIGADGTVAVICGFSDGDNYTQTLLIEKPDGTEITVETPPEAGKYPFRAAVTDSGRVFVSFLGGDNVYEAKEDGSCELFITMQNEHPSLMNATGELLVMDGYNYGAPLIYDTEKEEYIEDQVLKDFMAENYEKGNSFGSSWFEVYPFIGEENVIYIAGEKGLHRHVIGGSAVEQVIDGSLCTFANPAYGIGGMIMLENNEFMAVFSSGRLVKFVYDPDMPTVPAERLKVYSLKENDTIRQAVSLYQSANPEVYVEYSVGIGTGDSITRDDALKNLNTKIMAGDGPDVLILDNMPLDSYVEKGLLLDLSSFIDGLSGEEELFGNIVEAMKTDGKLYAMPCEIGIPMIMSEDKYLDKATDLTGLADMMEAIHKDKPDSQIFEIGSEKGILRFFSMTSVPAWTKENGEIDREAVTDYLKQVKRIYDAQMESAEEGFIENYQRSNESWQEEFGDLRDDSIYLRRYPRGLSYTAGFTQIVSAELTSLNDYNNIISVNKVAGFEDRKWKLMDGQCKDVFCAHTLMGISAASSNTVQAQDFIKLCLGKENQGSLFNGLMLNKAALDASVEAGRKNADEIGVYLWESSSNADGTRAADFKVYYADDEQIEELKSCIESLKTPYVENGMLEDAVYEEGSAYLKGEKSLEDAVDAIEKKISLYLAE